MKLILLTALCALSLGAGAQTIYGVGAAHEVDSATSNRSGLSTVEKTGVLAGMRNSYGQFDASVFEVRIRGEGFYDAQQGAELGYGNGFKAGKLDINGRAAMGKVRNRGLGSPSDTATYSTFGVTAGLPITPQLGVSVGFRYRPKHDLDAQQQYSLGASYMVNKHVMILGGVRQTRSTTQPILNGATIQARYYF